MRFISGIQPSGTITLGNYLGAIKNFVALQNEGKFDDILVFIADLHSITVPQDKTELRKNIKTLAALYLACGLDPAKTHIFIQSEVPAHAELSWILNCNTYIGELQRMTQFKDKSQKHQTEGVSTGLLTYPVLMASDIILYDANVVPIGQDQKQHLELTRDIAERFNAKYGETFVIPEGYMSKNAAKIMSLTDPLKKMSKSDDNPKSYISMLDDINVAKKKIKSAVTDSDMEVRFDKEAKPGISNLLTIDSAIENKEIKDIEAEFKGKTYAEFKEYVANVVADLLTNIQAKFNTIINSKELDQILDEGRDYANYLANKKISKVKNKVGLGRKN